jgi:hypothetical protein
MVQWIAKAKHKIVCVSCCSDVCSRFMIWKSRQRLPLSPLYNRYIFSNDGLSFSQVGDPKTDAAAAANKGPGLTWLIVIAVINFLMFIAFCWRHSGNWRPIDE